MAKQKKRKAEMPVGAGVARSARLKTQLPAMILGGLFVTYFAIKIAPLCTKSLLSGLLHISEVNWGFPIIICKQTTRTVFIFLLIYVGVCTYLVLDRKHFRRGIEKGSAQWADPIALNKKYSTKCQFTPKIMTQHIAVGYNDFAHRRNMNTLIVGGSGAGKTRFYAKPNLLQGNVSFICLDPKGELLRDTGAAMKAMGYNVKVLNLIKMNESDKYNPFEYLSSELDIMRLCTNLFKATGQAQGGSQDPFWDNAATALLMALVAYLHYEAPPEEQNFAMVGEMLRAAAITSERANAKSALDRLFDELPPEHVAKKFYKDYRVGGAKTLQSIQITLSARLNKFNIKELQDLTRFDTLDLGSLGEQKTVLYALIPDSDSSFNFLVSILYTQLFQTLIFSADFNHSGKLPVPVHFLMDEFANVALPDDFDKILATIRSRKISVSIIIQNIAQLKTLFEKQWESIIGNCDEFLYLGGNEQGSHKYVSESLGKETIDMNTYGRTRGKSGSSSTNSQIEGRDLLTPDEVRLIPDSKAVLLIRGERPCLDDKYDLLLHPNIDLGPDGKHGSVLNYSHAGDALQKEDEFRENKIDLLSESFTTLDSVEGYSAETLTTIYLGGT